MIKEMRRKDRQISENEAKEILEKGEYGILSTIGDEYPYAVPVNYVLVDDAIYIHGTCESGQKYDNIKKNPKICFTVVVDAEVLPSKFSERYESAIVLGTIELLHDEKKITILEQFIDKYGKDFKESGIKYIHAAKDKVSIYKISIEQITGKARR